MSLENALYLIEWEPDSGAICRLYHKPSQIELITEPRLADSFRLLLPLPDRQANYLLGKGQRLGTVQPTETGVRLMWPGPLVSEEGERFDLDVELELTLAGEALIFRLTVINRSPLRLAEVWYPLLGGLTGLGERRATQWTKGKWFLNPSQPDTSLAPTAAIEFYPFPMGMPWVDIYNANRNLGVYFAAHDPLGRYKGLRWEILPGLEERSVEAASDREGVQATLPFGAIGWVFYPYTQPGNSFTGPPVALQFHQGDWHTGAQIYRSWFTSHFAIRAPRTDWLRQETAYEDLMFLLPEGKCIKRFNGIPDWAKNAHDHGINTVLISGWNVGGHDADYPLYEPDPRLGTWQELEGAIQECHQLGVRVLFFVNTIPIHIDTDWYQRELHRYSSRDAQGNIYGPFAFGMGTVSARIGRNTRQYTWASVGIPTFRQILVRQMQKLAEIGADGLHVDKFVAWSLDFNPELAMPPDQASPLGQLQCLEEIVKACRAINPAFAISVESHRWDRALEFTNVTWGWPSTWDYDLPAGQVKYTFPEFVDSLGVVQPYDYNVVNNAVRYGFFLLIGPAHYTGSLADALYKPLADYIREVQQLREELKETLYLGEFLDILEVAFEGPASTRCGVHRNTRTGKRAAVIVNFAANPQNISLKAFQNNDGGAVHIYQPFAQRQATHLPVRMAIPGERFAVIMETDEQSG